MRMNEMLRGLKRIVAVIITAVLIVSGLYRVQELTRLKVAAAKDLKYESFFDYADEYDVLYFGTSHVMYGISPLEIWNDYGITSYNWGSPSCTIPSTYWKLINVLDYTTPKLIVIDCFRATWTYKSYNTYRLHEAFDAFPLSRNKWSAVNDLMKDQPRMEDGEMYSDEDRANILFPLSAYHTRWDELGSIDFVNKYIDTKGCEFEITVAEPIDISNTTEKTEITEEMQGVTYLRKIIEECNSRNIPVLLVYLPFPIEEYWKKESNMIQDIADEYDVQYLNFTNLDVVDYASDYADPSSHMNIAGQKKVSEFLGKYILETYNITDRRQDAISAQWNNWYQTYKEYESWVLRDQTDLASYLMLLYKSNDTIFVDMRNSSLIDNEAYYSLLSGLGEYSKDITKSTDFIIVQNGEAVVLDDFRNNGATIDTEIGEISFFNANDRFGLYVNGDEYYVGDTNEEVSLRIQVKDGDSLIDNIGFSYTVNPETLSVNVTSAERK